ncbi:guanylate cyclase 32E-like isoform X2 [Aphidius gifuensis]|uniref:guanylate cyclase 32E-like isoform X2 n=1 Tax=Aphidius gifuensis TaxID=684658 RepID=UPI001CDCEAA0|nr:guanylate cyclase 32E-like isoform X2 [Aphidius gifuensis]
MQLDNLKRVCLLLTAINGLVNDIVNGETFTIGYITGSKRRPGNFEYQRPGFRISGAINLAVHEVNTGELGKRGHKLEFIIGETYGEEETSIRVTADFWTKNVSAYIGPQETCVHEGRMAAAFNLPMISYFCMHRETSNKAEFPTFARTKPSDTQISKSVASVLLAFNWTKITFVHINNSDTEFNNKMLTVSTAILETCETFGIIVNHHKRWSESYHTERMINPFHDIVESTYIETRIYVILGNYDEHMGLLMALDQKKLLDNGEYWVVGVDIEQYDKNRPDKYLHGLLEENTNPSLLRAYESYFSIVGSATDYSDNFTNIINEYRKKPPFNFINPIENYGGVVQIVPETIYLYDAVHLYAKSLLSALSEGRDPRDGRKMLAGLYGTHYRSAMGYLVYMDKNGDAEANYTLIALENNPDKGHGLYPIGHFVGKEEITNLPKLRLVKKISWPDGAPPIAEPFCGYHGEKCNCEIIGGIAGGFLLILMAIVLVLYRNWRYEQELDSLLWKVNYKDIQIKEEKEETVQNDAIQKSNIKPVVRTSQVSLSSNPDADFRYSMIYTQIGFYRGRMFAIKNVRKKSIEITREMKKELKVMRDLRHDNLNAFVGACTDPPNICIVVEYCSRGSLKDIIENEDMKLDNMFMASLVGDVIRGMMFLHESVIKYHGNLTSSNCLVDSRWVVKIADFGLREFKRDAECKSEDILKKYQCLLYRAPELLRTRMDEPNTREYQKSDVYSFSLVLYELHGRHGPFGVTQLTSSEILKRIIDSGPDIDLFRPPLDQLENCFDFVRDCLVECWSEDPENRPDFKIIRNKLRPLRKGMKPNIFDNMMAMMEKYANNLEALVDERTDQLNEEKKKTDALLYEMLPRFVAEQLKRGHKVEAECFDCVTIYFSDIVGFTSMSAESTPLQVVDFLNDLYTCFDSTIENYDVYKIETIGDAYMVVSGLPIRNDVQHAGEIASMSLCLLEAIKQFTIRHRPMDKLQLRIGIHSGPVCAGVVGLKMPRYCLFGDTVNTASRMESSGSPLKIHCSQETKFLLDRLGGFHLVERGIVSMKGKGDRLTYWLVGEELLMREKRKHDRIERKNGKMPDLLVPKSSMKNKKLNRHFLRCSNNSQKRLRFASSDHIDKKIIINNKLDSIIDNSPCKAISSICNLKNFMDHSRSSSNSCPCVEQLDYSDEPIDCQQFVQKNDCFFPPLLYDNYCKSEPSSPRHSANILNCQKNVQSIDEVDGWDATPLIRSNTCTN